MYYNLLITGTHQPATWRSLSVCRRHMMSIQETWSTGCLSPFNLTIKSTMVTTTMNWSTWTRSSWKERAFCQENFLLQLLLLQISHMMMRRKSAPALLGYDEDEDDFWAYDFWAYDFWGYVSLLSIPYVTVLAVSTLKPLCWSFLAMTGVHWSACNSFCIDEYSDVHST